MKNIHYCNTFEKFSSAFHRLSEIYPEIITSHIALAVSGGSDSMCLVLMFEFLYAQGKIKKKPMCLIVDHKLRTESTDEAHFVSQYLFSKKIQNEILTWIHNDIPKSNIHRHAREARYALLIEFCKTNSIKYLCSAHNWNDQAENTLMRIIRGSGISGIASIKECLELFNIVLLRPMLQIKKAEVISMLTDHNWQWVEDNSNYSQRYERTKIRSLIQYVENSNITDASLFKQRLNLLAENARRAEIFIEKYTLQKERDIVFYSKFHYALLDLKQLHDAEDEIFLRLLKRVFVRIGVFDETHIRLKSLLLLKQKVKEYISYNKANYKFKQLTLGGCSISILNDYLFITQEYKFLENIKIVVTEHPAHIYWFKDKIDCNQIYQLFPNASYIAVCSLEAYQILKKQQLKIDEQIIFFNKRLHINMPYNKIILSTPVVYDALKNPLYSIAFKVILKNTK